MREYRENNREKVNAATRDWKINNKDKVRDSKLRERYGITLVDYQRMLEEQNSRCAICQSPDVNRKNSEHFLVDHCHVTGEVRGLLCYKCNIGLGAFSDSVENLNSAIDYLTKSS